MHVTFLRFLGRHWAGIMISLLLLAIIGMIGAIIYLAIK